MGFKIGKHHKSHIVSLQITEQEEKIATLILFGPSTCACQHFTVRRRGLIFLGGEETAMTHDDGDKEKAPLDAEIDIELRMWC